jgi:hypothetical protein
MRQSSILLAGTICLTALLPTAASAAQVRCPEARTITGECVNPAITQALRNQSIAYTQQKLSYTAPPRLPSADFGVLIARDWNEMLNLFTFPPVGPAPTTNRRP